MYIRGDVTKSLKYFVSACSIVYKDQHGLATKIAIEVTYLTPATKLTRTYVRTWQTTDELAGKNENG